MTSWLGFRTFVDPEVETELERCLSSSIMRTSGRTQRRRLKSGETLYRQGDDGADLFLVLDGVASVEVDGEILAEMGPGAVLGERAVIEGGHRTATVRAVTPLRGVVVPPELVDREALEELSSSRRREEEL